MKMTMTTPCSDCPFRRTGFIPLRADRVREIAQGLLTGNTSFPCHKTVEWGEGTDGEDIELHRDKQEHCGGALIFCEKNHRPTQLMRVYERTRSYDPRKLTKLEDVFDTLAEMLRAHKRRNDAMSAGRRRKR